MKWAIRSVLLALFAVLLAGGVRADSVYSYALTQGSTTIASFDLPEFPATDPITASSYMGATGTGFVVTPIDLVIDNTASSDSLEFFNSSQFGGLEDLPLDPTATPAFNLAGDQPYSGDEAANPEMSLGTFAMHACGDSPTCDPEPTVPYTLKVTESSTGPVSTPEPSSLLLLFAGLFALVLLRKRGTAN